MTSEDKNIDNVTSKDGILAICSFPQTALGWSGSRKEASYDQSGT